MTLPERLKALGGRATKGPWIGEPKRLVIHGTDGPLMSYMKGHRGSVEGETVTLGSERVADHELVALLRNSIPELLAALADSVRLDWMAEEMRANNRPTAKIIEREFHDNGKTLRQAIDTAILDAARPTACATDGGGT